MRTSWLLVVVACGGGGGDSMPVDARPPEVTPDACTRHTIFLNRRGGVYHQGNAPDAITNTTNIGAAPGDTRFVPPATISNEDWTEVMTCVSAKLASFPITVTEINPGNVPHVEVVVVDDGAQFGSPGVWGACWLQPCVGGYQTAAKNTIAWAVLQPTNPERCWNISMMIGFTLGLANVNDACEDVMSLDPNCDIAAKSFTNVAQARNLFCDGGPRTQNAAAEIAAKVPSCP